MRLVEKDAESLSFELEPNERRLLVFLLRRYPVLDPAYHQIARPADLDSFASEQQLLTESMSAEQASNRARVATFIQKWLASDDESPAGELTRLKLTFADADWLLRIVNDVRVGSWVRLGRPESEDLHSPTLAARNIQDFSAMELGGLVQSILLHAMND